MWVLVWNVQEDLWCFWRFRALLPLVGRRVFLSIDGFILVGGVVGGCGWLFENWRVDASKLMITVWLLLFVFSLGSLFGESGSFWIFLCDRLC